MKLFKKRWVAAVIALLVICGSTIFSVHRTLGGECRKISDTFYSGVFDPEWGARKSSVSSQLGKRSEAANGLASMGETYQELEKETQALRQARNHLLNEAASIPAKAKANQALQKAYDNLAGALKKQPLSQRESEMMDEYGRTFKGAQNVIENVSGYNDHVREFERITLQVFPANVLKGISFIDLPELFE